MEEIKDLDFYETAHLFVAAIRVLEHKNNASPSNKELCEYLSFPLEQGNLVCNKLSDLEILEPVEGAFGVKLFVKNHLKLEEISRETKNNDIKEALDKFKNSREELSEKIKSHHIDQKTRKKELFDEIEKQFKKGLNK